MAKCGGKGKSGNLGNIKLIIFSECNLYVCDVAKFCGHNISFTIMKQFKFAESRKTTIL